ncbi:MAG: hypothetical protein JNK85_06670, partial [Verrucomicrobiales bacterium]|nr:hypothetical protein [Verrucomicrobiales bacterium]
MPLKSLQRSVRSRTGRAQGVSALAPQRVPCHRPGVVGSLMRLQQAQGNRVVARMMVSGNGVGCLVGRVQRKVMVGAAGDEHEQEAERVAQRVVSMSEVGLAQRAGS